MLFLCLVEDALDVLTRIWQPLSPDDGLEYLLQLCLLVIVHNTWAIDEIYPLGVGDVLPALGLSWNGGHLATILFHEGIDNRTLATVGVSNETDRDVLLVFVNNIKLLQ